MRTSKIASLTDRIIKPGEEGQPAHFVGRGQRGAVAIGLMRDAEGQALAYVSDGLFGTWYSGKVRGEMVTATAADGGVLEANISDGRARGKATFAGKPIRFDLEVAGPGAGLRRLKRTVGRKSTEAVFIVVNDGAIFGAAESGGAVVSAYRIESNEDDAKSSFGPATPRSANGYQFIRCSILVLRISWIDQKYYTGQIGLSEWSERGGKLRNLFESLSCDDYYYAT